MDGSPTAIADSERASLAAWVTSVSASDHKSSQQRNGRATHEPRLAYLQRHTAPEPPPTERSRHPGIFCSAFLRRANSSWQQTTCEVCRPPSTKHPTRGRFLSAASTTRWDEVWHFYHRYAQWCSSDGLDLLFCGAVQLNFVVAEEF